jgi:hypothetical protein
MSAANILSNKALVEFMDSVRRMINDIDSDQPAIQDHMLRELVIAEFVHISHEAGWDPREPTRASTGTSMLQYTLNAGEYQTTEEPESDIVASSVVYCDRSRIPLEYLSRAQLENMINNDVKLLGAVTRGIPRVWTMKYNQVTATDMRHRMLVYPAADVTTAIYWPRTVVDTENVDPTSSTGRAPFSYQLTWALEYKVAAICCRGMSDEAAKRIQIDKQSLGDQYWENYQAAIKREQEERSMHALQDQVVRIEV